MARRAMTSEAASAVKLNGHSREHLFADLIGGEVIKGTGKADIRRGDETWSVKSGTWAQIFLYRETAAATLGVTFHDCIKAFPDKRADYVADKTEAKTALQQPMRALCAHLANIENLEAFLHRVMFADSINYLVIEKGNKFLEFKADDVVKALVSSILVKNSKARTKAQMDDQKVVFHLEGVKKALGEIEIRSDSDAHYRELKCRFNVPMLRDFLESRCAVNEYLM